MLEGGGEALKGEESVKWQCEGVQGRQGRVKG